MYRIFCWGASVIIHLAIFCKNYIQNVNPNTDVMDYKKLRHMQQILKHRSDVELRRQYLHMCSNYGAPNE